jgi:ABC-type multidrug transport system ATPase subunit
MLLISRLNKTYPNQVKALSNINLKISKGMFGLLGPNGAGKSSLMRTLATLQDPDEGAIHFEGIDLLRQKEQIRTLLGYLPQEFGVYPSISAEQMLDHLVILKGIVDGKKRKETVDYLLDVTNLSDHRKKKLGTYSGGMKQRFGIAQALIGNPKMIIVDEPTAGLDPAERDRFHNLLSTIGEETLVILSTHIVSDVSQLCNDMAIIHNGQVLVQTSPLKAITQLKGKIWKLLVPKSETDSLSQKYQVISSRLLHSKWMLRVFSESSPGPDFESVEPDLEDVYFSFIKKMIGVGSNGSFTSLV